MDKRKSVLNVTVSVFSHIVLIAGILIRRLLIQHIGNDANGLNSLYSSIIGMLSVAELGIGRAIVYAMYKPIINGDIKQVSALYGLYKRLYWTVGAVIFSGGLLVLPFLPKLIGDYETVSINIYIPFILTLVSVVLSFLYSAKTALIEAHKDNYITTGILTVSGLVRHGLQVIVILIWKSFTLYLACQIISTLLIWVITEIVIRRRYEAIISRHEKIDQRTKIEIGKYVKAMFMHKVGNVLVNTIDNLVISAFIGVIILGKYSNYTLIIGMITSFLALFFNPLTSVVGHLYAAGNVNETKKWFNRFYSLNFCLGVIFFLGYYAVIDCVVGFFFGQDLEVSRSISFIITLNQFTTFMRTTTLLFRDASGTFYYDRWKPIGEGIANLVLSLLFVKIFPEEYRVVGVIVATIITTLFICHIVDPFVVFKHVFKEKPNKYYLRNYSFIALFTVMLGFMTLLTKPSSSPITGIIVNGFISVGLSMVTLGLVAVFDRSFRSDLSIFGQKGMAWLRSKYIR